MGYTKRPDIDTSGPQFTAGESVVELTGGELVAVGCAQLRCKVSQCTIFCPRARWIDATGTTQMDAQGHAVVTEHRHTTSDAEMATHGDAVVRSCVMLVLGEPLPVRDCDGELLPVVPFSADAVLTSSIVRGIAAAKATFDPVDTGALL